ncbi:MAG: hypothetical protein KKD18_01045 [Nanoarchaeota archaeon]|nr:hypothetical protein [Nanoarchaeota archaeon]MBU0976981.1 hypothetical protein [Nanoarchaeota archaeon]
MPKRNVKPFWIIIGISFEVIGEMLILLVAAALGAAFFSGRLSESPQIIWLFLAIGIVLRILGEEIRRRNKT